jgi:hypothetical protein
VQVSANPFDINSGSFRLGMPNYYVPLFAVCIALAWTISVLGLTGGLAIIVVPFIAAYLYILFRNPVAGLYSTVCLGFIILGIGRYVSIPQIGISIDSILTLTFLSLFFRNFYTRIDWKPAKRDITLLAFIWMSYGLISSLNPEIKMMSVWLGSFRGVSLYMFLFITLTLLLINTNRRLDYFLYIWSIFSILVSLKGISQIAIGVDPWEKKWLDAGAHFTLVLFGKLRAFSFLSDAGQFGANQAYSAVVFFILSLSEKNKRKKILFIVTAVLGIYGMFLSGTRGAISVPLAGFMLYFILRRNVVVMITGVVLLAIVFVFFKYTSIGQDNQQIRRMRTAFDPNDASLQLRLSNQRKLRTYLSTRPFGGGLGHAGSKAKKKLPDTFLANVATDSWYVMIWAEQGIVGLILHLFILFYIIIKSAYYIMFRIRDPIIKMKMSALAAGMFGVMAASYGNAVLGSFPTGPLIYISMAVMLSADIFDNEAVTGNVAKSLYQGSDKMNTSVRSNL